MTSGTTGTATTRETGELVNAVTQAMNQLIERFPDEQRSKLSQWVEVIEDAADAKVHNLQKRMPEKLKRKNPDIVVAAAIYDAFIEYETRTDVKVGLNFMQSSLGYNSCSINNAWKKLYDNRVFLRGEFLELEYGKREGTLGEVISNVIEVLKSATDSPKEEAKKWLDEIEREALELSATLPHSSMDRYDVLLIASAVIYAATKQHKGKMIVHFGQRELSMLASTSPAMISKCWLDLFGS